MSGTGRSGDTPAAPDWNPVLYSRFEAERTRPARDLLAEVPIDHPTAVVDLGCGPGNSTALLAARYPEAALLGLDTSPAMVAAARKRLPGARFEEADLALWSPDRQPDLIFANAVLQWLPDHAVLFPRLLHLLRPGGVLAVQMPDNLDEPSHRLMQATAEKGPWVDLLRGAAAERTPRAPIENYYDWLCSAGASVDVWRTIYHHPMTSPAAIVEWLRATGLRPYLSRLSSAEAQQAFTAAYEAKIAEAYPARPDGQRLLAFPRIFIVATRRAS